MLSKRSMAKLSEVLTERREKPDLYAILSGEIPIVAKIGFDTGKIELREESKTKTNMILIKPGDLVISGINAAKGAIAIYGAENIKPAAATIHYSSYIINKEKADPVYLWYFFRSKAFKKILINNSPGGIKTEVKPKRLLPIKIPLPLLEEQKRTIARVENLMVGVEEARRLRVKAVEEANALFPSIFSKVISSSGATSRQLNDLCLQITDGEHATPPRVDSPDIPLTTAKNVRDGYLDLKNTNFVERNTAEKCWRRCHPQHEDILMVCVGATTGRVCRLVNPPPIVIVRSVAMLRPNRSIIDPRFLEYALESSECQSQIWESVKQAAQPCLYIHRMKELSIPVPPLPEQRRIVAYLDSLQENAGELKKLQDETEKEMEELILSILDQAFKEKL